MSQRIPDSHQPGILHPSRELQGLLGSCSGMCLDSRGVDFGLGKGEQDEEGEHPGDVESLP